MAKLLNWLDKNGLTLAIFILLVFIPLYPKFPLLDIRHTWVYIRLEDLLLALIGSVWLIQLLRRKAVLKTPLTVFIFAYWFTGFISSLFALLVLRLVMADIFPQLVVLHFLRRLEYMFVFFVAFTTIKGVKTVKNYLFVLALSVALVCFYGFGQKFFGFPAFLTMNEEFAKGAPLYLGPQSRLTSTFAGHYDLAAFLVFVIAIFAALIFAVKKNLTKLALLLLVFASFLLLLFTSSRVSFAAYLLGISFTLWLQKKKWLIVPVIVFSLLALSFVSGASERFGKTFRVENVVYDANTGQAVGALDEGDDEEIDELPLGSGYLDLPIIQTDTPQATQTAKIKKAKIYELKTATESSQIATVSGEFLIKKAVVYDISFTTRLQGTWARALTAFDKSPLLGTGYSSIGLGSDSSFIRSLGETGLFGFLVFISIFAAFGLLLKSSLSKVKDKFAHSFLTGVAGGSLGLMINAFLIDVFEASKMAYIFWIVLGIAVGLICRTVKVDNLFKEALKIAALPLVQLVVLLIIGLAVFLPSLNNYFVADDFTWVRWANQSSLDTIINNFYYSAGFFYRPLAKAYFFLVQPIFGFHPNGYHLTLIAFHLMTSAVVFAIALILSRRKVIALIAALLFMLHPLNAEKIYWISSISALMENLLITGSFLAYLSFRTFKNKLFLFCLPLSLILFVFGLASHEAAVVLPLLIVAFEIFLGKDMGQGKKLVNRFFYLAPFLVLLADYLYLRTSSGAHGLSGDYNYNLIKLPFNAVGNLFGYFGLTLFGERFLPFYLQARDSLRSSLPLAAVISLPLVTGLLLLIKKLWRRKLILFSFSWFIIFLLPFLGLGNITERYLYPAHFGLLLPVALLVNYLFGKLQVNSRKAAGLFLAAVLLLTTGFLSVRSRQHEARWQVAGEQARQILLAFGTNFQSLGSGTTLYFVDLPIRYQRAWVFPVGLTDGLWLLYHSQDLTVQNLPDVQTAQNFKRENPTSKVFIFDDGVLKQVVLEEE